MLLSSLSRKRRSRQPKEALFHVGTQRLAGSSVRLYRDAPSRQIACARENARVWEKCAQPRTCLIAKYIVKRLRPASILYNMEAYCLVCMYIYCMRTWSQSMVQEDNLRVLSISSIRKMCRHTLCWANKGKRNLLSRKCKQTAGHKGGGGGVLANA